MALLAVVTEFSSVDVDGMFRKKAQLSVVSVQTTDIPPKETVTYTKQTQTIASPERGGKSDSSFFHLFLPSFQLGHTHTHTHTHTPTHEDTPIRRSRN